MSKKSTTLYAPDGRKYEAADRVEVTRLKAHGYSEKAPKSPAKVEAPKADEPKS